MDVARIGGKLRFAPGIAVDEYRQLIFLQAVYEHRVF
jgi:hypothetical protein